MTQNIAVIGGDGRYLELIRQLQTLNHTTISLVGFDKIEQGFTGLQQKEWEELEPEEIDILILPITGTDQDGYIDTVFSDQRIKLHSKWLERLKSDAYVFTGMSNNYLDQAMETSKATLIPLLNRDDVAIYNSIPTAEGTIMMAMENTDFTIHGSNICVTGFGRVGMTVANKFSALGAHVSVASTYIRDLARITERGWQAIPLDTLHNHVERVDILINTIPSLVIGRKTIQHMPSHSIIIDLASKPGGTDFEFAKRRGIKAILAKSLPGVVAPKTAGKILADVIKQIMNER